MDQSIMLVLVISLIVIMTVVILKPLERFNNVNNKVREEGTVVNSDALPGAERDFAKYLVDIVLENVNKNYNRHFVLGNLEGIEKMPLKDGNGSRYLIKCFIYTTNDYTNRKFVFDLNVNKADGVINVNRVYFGDSQNPVIERVPVSERGSVLFKPNSNLNNVEANDNSSSLDSGTFIENSEVKNYATNPIERVSDLRHPEVDLIGNVFPCRIVHHEWDTASLMKVDCPDERKNCKGPYSGTRPPMKVPQFNPTIFEGNSSIYHDLFDLSQDAASRPVGIG